MELLKQKNPKAFEYLNKLDKSTWTRSHFPIDIKCDLLCNNISEAFNKYILEARDEPIISMMEMIRKLTQRRFVHKKMLASDWKGDICPRIVTKLEELDKISRGGYVAYWNEDTRYEVTDGLGYLTLDTAKKTCDCRV
ncbi:uncharacterized protein A4U43_C05F10370 [Asparagus officinalis]|uniref:Uncharacterized protein n=1 Tax=Asparagus officinalis TaxID=4686 RepID=A0A5P1ET99_ASPOF|nr:uncharacterized protein A4U43_C05F10370 [Asparagus officinalis]